MSRATTPYPDIRIRSGIKAVRSRFEGGAYCVRVATLSDLDALCAIERAVFPAETYQGSILSRRQIRHLMTRGNALFLAVEGRGALCGYALLLFRKNALSARLYSLAVLPAYQGHGAGSSLFNAVEKVCAEAGVDRLYLEAREDNTAFLNWYERRGFSVYKRIEGYYGRDGAALKMRAPVVGRS